MYLNCGTCPNIVFVVKRLSRHNLDPRVKHLQIAKQVLQYLRKTITFDIKSDKGCASHQSRLEGKYSKLGVHQEISCEADPYPALQLP